MRLTTCFILLLQTTLCLAQPPSDYKFQSISIAQGLSQSSAYSVIQDHLGYIWAGTQGGMNRYDGYGVKKFEPISADSASIAIGWRTASMEDDKGNIWTGSSRCTISMYNRRDDRWINYTPGFSEEFRKKFPNYQSTNLGLVVQLNLDTLRQKLFEIEERDFASGDVFVMLSDGLPEATNASTELFDYKRVQEIIEKNGSKDAESIKNELVAAVDLWLSGENNPDDITIIVIKKK